MSAYIALDVRHAQQAQAEIRPPLRQDRAATGHAGASRRAQDRACRGRADRIRAGQPRRKAVRLAGRMPRLHADLAAAVAQRAWPARTRGDERNRPPLQAPPAGARRHPQHRPAPQGGRLRRLSVPRRALLRLRCRDPGADLGAGELRDRPELRTDLPGAPDRQFRPDPRAAAPGQGPHPPARHRLSRLRAARRAGGPPFHGHRAARRTGRAARRRS